MHDFLDHVGATTQAEPRRLCIRRADVLQLEQVIRLDRRTDDPVGLAEIYRQFHGKDCAIKAADFGTNTTLGPVLGYVFYEKGASYYHVNRVRVSGDYRRGGIGRAMVEHVKGLLNDVRPIAEMMVHECDLPTQCLLRSCGFACINQYAGIHAGGRDAYAFRYQRPGTMRSFMQEEGR